MEHLYYRSIRRFDASRGRMLGLLVVVVLIFYWPLTHKDPPCTWVPTTLAPLLLPTHAAGTEKSRRMFNTITTEKSPLRASSCRIYAYEAMNCPKWRSFNSHPCRQRVIQLVEVGCLQCDTVCVRSSCTLEEHNFIAQCAAVQQLWYKVSKCCNSGRSVWWTELTPGQTCERMQEQTSTMTCIARTPFFSNSMGSICCGLTFLFYPPVSSIVNHN